MWKWWIGKTAALHVRHPFLYLSLPSLHDDDRRETSLTHVLRRTFSQLQRNLLTFDKNWTRGSKRDKVWSSANTLFKWRFRSRHRRYCFSSLTNYAPVNVNPCAPPARSYWGIWGEFSVIWLACVASVSPRVRRERRDESKKKWMNFCAMTRLETLATQAIIWQAK